jgi:hypothetical protein
MKKLTTFAIAAILGLSLTNAHAQLAAQTKKETKTERKAEHHAKREVNKEAISYRSKNQFDSDFDGVSNVHWNKGPEFEEVTFTQNGQKMTAYYDYTSQLVGTTVDKKYADLPAKAQQEIKKQYKDYIPGAVVLFDDNEANDTAMVFRGKEFADADHYFVTLTKNGKENIVMVSMDGVVSYFK